MMGMCPSFLAACLSSLCVTRFLCWRQNWAGGSICKEDPEGKERGPSSRSNLANCSRD